MADKKKVTTAVVAGVTALALVLGGTFAWTSISQQAKNEAAGIVNVGGRLHDDFNGTNKDVYVENFTDPLNGGQPIYARIRLDEYMEVGQDAGGYGTDVDSDGTVEAVPVIDGTSIDDMTTWKTFVPSSITDTAITCSDCAEANGLCTIHEHWKWTVGGSTIFMPTFNKDKDSLTADINGTYEGTVEGDKVYYDDYVVYEEGGLEIDVTTDGENALTDAEGTVGTVTGYAVYDDDTNTEDDGGTRSETETHTAKATGTATVMTMQEWLDAGSQPGNFWVYDADGWAYWANPIMPGESTGLLLDSIEMFKNPGEKCYYSINVVAQFATVGDWEYFNGDDENPEFDGSENALSLLEKASANVTVVTVTNESGVTTVDPGDTVYFSAETNKETDEEPATFTWAVYDADMNLSETSSVSDNGTLTVGAEETSATLTVVATDDASGAVGMNSIAVATQMEIEGTIEKSGVTPYSTYSIHVTEIEFDATTNLVAYNADGEQVTVVAWSVSPTYDDENLKGVSITNDGALTVEETETTVYITVRATLASGEYIENALRIDSPYLEIEARYSVGSDANALIPGGTVTLSATDFIWYNVYDESGEQVVYDDLEYSSKDVTWSLGTDYYFDIFRPDSSAYTLTDNGDGTATLTHDCASEDECTCAYSFLVVCTHNDNKNISGHYAVRFYDHLPTADNPVDTLTCYIGEPDETTQMLKDGDEVTVTPYYSDENWHEVSLHVAEVSMNDITCEFEDAGNTYYDIGVLYIDATEKMDSFKMKIKYMDYSNLSQEVSITVTVKVNNE